jgi:hypothetical protein
LVEAQGGRGTLPSRTSSHRESGPDHYERVSKTRSPFHCQFNLRFRLAVDQG